MGRIPVTVEASKIEETVRLQEKGERSALARQFLEWACTSTAQSTLRNQVASTNDKNGFRIVSDALVERSTSTLRVQEP